MSISNLLVPNDLDIYAHSITADTLVFDNVAAQTLAVNTITSNPAGNNVNLQGIIFYPTQQVAFPATTLNRKLSLYSATAPTDTTEFYGFGVQSNTLVYETPSTSANHVFYAGTGPSTNVQLLSIPGNGGGIIMPSVGATTAGQLNYYEIFDTIINLAGAITSVTSPVAISITRLGNTVTITNLTYVLGIYAANGAITSTIPARFYPSNDVSFPIMVFNGNVDAIGTLYIKMSGVLEIWSGPGGSYSMPNFSMTGVIGCPPFSVTYNLS